MSRRLRVKLLDGRTFFLNLDPHISVPDLKAVLEKEVGVSKENCRIISKAQVFQDDKRLSDYVTQDQDTIHVINRPPPPPPPPEMSSQSAGDQSTNQQPQGQSTSFSFTPAPGGQGSGHFVFRQESGGDPSQFIQNIFGQMTGGGDGPGAPGQPAGFQNIFQNMFSSMFNNPQQRGAPPQGPQPPPPQGPQPPPSTGAPASSGQGASQASNQQQAASSFINTGPLDRINDILNFIHHMGPGFSLPSQRQEESETQQMARFLELLNFALSRLSPVLQRGGSLLREESQESNLRKRRETQRISNSIGIIFQELGVGLMSVAHLFQNLEVGPTAGAYNIDREPMDCVSHIIENHLGPRDYQRARQILLQRVQQVNQAGIPQQTPLSFSTAPRSQTQQQEDKKYEPEDMFDEMPRRNNEPTPVQHQQASGASAAANNPLLRRPQAQSGQQGTAGANQVGGTGNLIQMMQNRMNTPQGQMMQQMMGGFAPLFNEIMQNSQGASSIADIARNIQASRGVSQEVKEEDKDVLTKLMEVLEINDLLAVFMGNFNSLLHIQPKIKTIIRSEMQKSRALDSETSKTEQPDTLENRKYLASKMAKFIESGLQVPQNLRSHVKPGFDPVVATKQIIEDSSLKLISFFMDFKNEDHQNPEQGFTGGLKNILRELVGKVVEELRGDFSGGTEDVIGVMRYNLSTQVSRETGEEENGMLTSMITNMLMRYVTLGYQQYMAQKDTENIERRLHKDQKDGNQEQQKNQSETSKNFSELENELILEWKDDIARDEEIQKTLEPQRPFSNMYRALNSMADLGSGIKTELMEFGMTPGALENENQLESLKNKEDVLERRIRSTLENVGYPIAAIKKSMQERPVPVMLSKRYKELLKEEIKERAKNDPDFQEGRWSKIDQLLKKN